MNKILKGVQIIELDALPAKYFFRPRIITKLEREIAADIRAGSKRIPAGTRALWARPGSFSYFWHLLRSALTKLWRHIHG